MASKGAVEKEQCAMCGSAMNLGAVACGACGANRHVGIQHSGFKWLAAQSLFLFGVIFLIIGFVSGAGVIIAFGLALAAGLIGLLYIERETVWYEKK